MFKKVVLIFAVLVALLAFTSPALALAPGTYYVDTAYTGTEVGSPTQPFNTLEEAVSAAQNNPQGGYIYTRGTSANWVYYGYISTVIPPDTGVALSGPALFALLAVLSLGLILGGWFLMRRSRARTQLA